MFNVYKNQQSHFISGSKRLDRITLYVQLVSTSYLVQNLDGITLYVRDVQIHETSGGQQVQHHKHEINFSFRLIAVLFSN
jgi:hypothetical protein